MNTALKTKEELKQAELNGIAFLSTANFVVILSLMQLGLILTLTHSDGGATFYLGAALVNVFVGLVCLLFGKRKALLESTYVAGALWLANGVSCFWAADEITHGIIGCSLASVSMGALMLVVFSSVRRGYRGNER